MSDLLIIFAKAPEPGKVKTRLSPILSEEDAADLQKAFIQDLIELTEALTHKSSTERIIACTPITHSFFQSLQQKENIRLMAQEGADLGERMKNAFQWGFKNDFKNIVIIGCDSPTLPVAFIHEAFEKLSSTDLVLGPGLDGGYYLIGSRALFPDLFIDLPWGTERVLSNTLEKISTNGCSHYLLPFWYDIDRPNDLALLRAHLPYLKQQESSIAKATAALLFEDPAEGFSKA